MFTFDGIRQLWETCGCGNTEKKQHVVPDGQQLYIVRAPLKTSVRIGETDVYYRLKNGLIAFDIAPEHAQWLDEHFPGLLSPFNFETTSIPQGYIARV